MNIPSKNLIFCIALMFFLVWSFLFIYAQEEQLIDICEGNYGISCGSDLTIDGTNFQVDDGEITFGENGKLILNQGKPNEISLEGSGIKISKLNNIIFTQENAFVIINGKKFENIDFNKANKIILDQKNGKIFSADFYTDSNGGTYSFNGNEVKVPANSRFIYSPGKGISSDGSFVLPNGAELLNVQGNIYFENSKANEIFIYNGNEINGVLNFDSKGNVFLINGRAVKINGVILENKGDLVNPNANLPIFFSDVDATQSGKTEYVVIDKSRNFFSYKEQETAKKLSGRSILITFKKGNYLFDNIANDEDYITISEKSIDEKFSQIIDAGPGNVIITRTPGNLPVVKNIGKGDSWISFDKSSFRLSSESFKYMSYAKGEGGVTPFNIAYPDGTLFGRLSEEGDFYQIRVDPEGKFNELTNVSKKMYEEWLATAEVTHSRAEELREKVKNPDFSNRIEEFYADDASAKSIYNKNKEILDIEGDEEISWGDLADKIGREDAEKLREIIVKKSELYYDLGQTGDLEKILGLEETKNLNDCISKGGDFRECFDTSYKFYGRRSKDCLLNLETCPKPNVYKFMRVKVGVSSK